MDSSIQESDDRHKHLVAIHEAGHAAIALALDIRTQLTELRLYRHSKTLEWQGFVRFYVDKELDEKLATQRFASSLAGPLSQLKFHPESAPRKLQELIKSEQGLLQATATIIKSGLQHETKTNWWPDLLLFQTAVQLNLDLEDFFEVEKQVSQFIETQDGEDLIRSVANKVLASSQLCDFFTPTTPLIKGLPESLSIRGRYLSPPIIDGYGFSGVAN